MNWMTRQQTEATAKNGKKKSEKVVVKNDSVEEQGKKKL
jgi:hypothetical protein